MPGPSNTNKKNRKSRAKNHNSGNNDEPSGPVRMVSVRSSPPIHALRPTSTSGTKLPPEQCHSSSPTDVEAGPFLIMPKPPSLYDPGNGPRVRNMRAFLDSGYFVQPPALDVPLCAEFAQEEVLEMLSVVLPEEMALILWYNKSRATSRVCPACQRIYRIGDVLPNHFLDDNPKEETPPSSEKLSREQSISGLCSPVCFILASFNYPDAIRSAWGRTNQELDDHTWALLNGPAQSNATGNVAEGLNLLMKMARLPDLGLEEVFQAVYNSDLLMENAVPWRVF